ncbi:DUF4252 domain-containing protein [Christiangramia marina]|uniref:DUF4252 domain-containing protein n=1 Tax=Christiangramia marina TaxID=409436 RepID=UPI003AA8332F
MKSIKLLVLSIFTLIAVSCNNEKSLQKYYVENQQDTDFLAVDVPTSLFTNADALDEEQKSTMETIKKINVLALEKEANPQKFEEEKIKLDEIFQDEKYQLLMRFGGSDRKAALYFIGEEDAIDELIVYGYDNEKGLGVARVLGENMDPEKIMDMMQSLKSEDINTGGIKGVIDIFGNSQPKQKDTTGVEMEIAADTL